MTAKTKKILTILLVTLGITAFVITPLAWFANYWNSNHPSWIGPGSNPNVPGVVMWMYNSENDGAATGQEEWIEYSNSNLGVVVRDPNVKIPSVVPTTSEFGYVYSSLHFGKIDNLVTLREDNKVYMRFEFNEKIHGSHQMTIQLSYATSGYTYTKVFDTDNNYVKNSVLDSIYLYDINGDDEDTAKFDLKNDMSDKGKPGRYTIEYKLDDLAAMQFLQFRYALSKTACAPGTDKFAELTFSDSVPISCGRAHDCKNNIDHLCTNCQTKISGCTDCTACAAEACGFCDVCKEALCDDCSKICCDACETCKPCDAGKCGQLTVEKHTEDLGLTADNDTYYLYIELTPLLDAYGMQENILDYFVPSYMLFDVKFDIEIG